jgi:hypothetical protein
LIDGHVGYDASCALSLEPDSVDAPVGADAAGGGRESLTSALLDDEGAAPAAVVASR